ncbi:MAG: CoA transferase [Chloroflexi bacterium]|nr:CoA transferase [Chloroflexota bacterium]
MQQPLEGNKVIHLSRVRPGHLTAMLLSDYGADVLSIEQPGYAAERAKGSGVPFTRPRPANRNQRNMTLNLRSPQGKEIFFKLVKDADVLLEGFRPGVTRRLGMDYETLEKMNPGLVYCALSGFGQEGAYRDYVAHDINYISYAGFLDLTGPADGPPALPGVNMADMAASVHAALGILTALMGRQKTGVGQLIDVNYLDGMIAWHINTADEYFAGDPEPKRGRTPVTGLNPCYNVYEASDGKYVSIGCNEPWFWQNLCKALGREDLVPHQKAAGEKREEIFRDLRAIFRTKTRDEWIKHLRATGTDIACAPVYSFGEALSDPNIARRMLVEAQGPDGATHRYIAPPFKLSKTPFQIKRLPPNIGEDTDEVLKSLGYDAAAIDGMRKEGVIE